jgi:hypothetical protein
MLGLIARIKSKKILTPAPGYESSPFPFPLKFSFFPWIKALERVFLIQILLLMAKYRKTCPKVFNSRVICGRGRRGEWKRIIHKLDDFSLPTYNFSCDFNFVYVYAEFDNLLIFFMYRLTHVVTFLKVLIMYLIKK